MIITRVSKISFRNGTVIEITKHLIQYQEIYIVVWVLGPWDLEMIETIMYFNDSNHDSSLETNDENIEH